MINYQGKYLLGSALVIIVTMWHFIEKIHWPPYNKWHFSDQGKTIALTFSYEKFYPLFHDIVYV